MISVRNDLRKLALSVAKGKSREEFLRDHEDLAFSYLPLSWQWAIPETFLVVAIGLDYVVESTPCLLPFLGCLGRQLYADTSSFDRSCFGGIVDSR